MPENELDIKILETRFWVGGCKIKGVIDAPKYKDYIPPPTFLKRLFGCI